MAVITGNTYPVRSKLRAMGGRWSPSSGGWIVPDAVAEEARRLVGGRQGQPIKKSGRRVCASCGSNINYGVYCGKCEFSR